MTTKSKEELKDCLDRVKQQTEKIRKISVFLCGLLILGLNVIIWSDCFNGLELGINISASSCLLFVVSFLFFKASKSVEEYIIKEINKKGGTNE